MNDPPPVVSEGDKDEEDPELSGWHGEEVDRDQVADMVGEEGPPGLRGAGVPLRHAPGDGPLGDIDAEVEEFTVYAWSTPQGIRRGHLPDEGGDLGIEWRAASGGLTGQLGPVVIRQNLVRTAQKRQSDPGISIGSSRSADGVRN